MVKPARFEALLNPLYLDISTLIKKEIIMNDKVDCSMERIHTNIRIIKPVPFNQKTRIISNRTTYQSLLTNEIGS